MEVMNGTEETNASFVGWGPASDPRFLVYIWIERPKSSPWGSVVAAPVFRDITQELIQYLEIPEETTKNLLFAKEG